MCSIVCAAVHCVGSAGLDHRVEASGIAVSECRVFAADTTSAGVGSVGDFMLSGSVVVLG